MNFHIIIIICSTSGLGLTHMARTGFRIKPEFFYRSLGQIFFFWNSNYEDLMEYQAFLNSIIPDIKITLSCHNEQIDFLDTIVYKSAIDWSYFANQSFFQTD